MSDLMTEHYALRGELISDLERDLVGPSSPREQLEDLPLTTYLLGVLHASSADTIDEWADVDPTDTDAEEGSGAAERTVELKAARYPSSMGMSLAVDGSECRTLRVACSAARYVPVGDDGEPLAGSVLAEAQRDELFNAAWRRVPLELPECDIDVHVETDERRPLGHGLVLFSRVRRRDGEPFAVTLILINTQPLSSRIRDLDARFQCAITVTSPEGAVFVERPQGRALNVDDDDLRSYELLFRHARSFATGHGCSTSWPDTTAERVSTVSTEVLPRAAVRVAQSNPEIESPVLSLRHCAEAPKARLVADLRAFGADYRSWIQKQSEVSSHLPDHLRQVAGEHLHRCVLVADRILDGVELLEEDADALLAFRLMNEAMLSQRARTDWIRAGAPGAEPEHADGTWRPFQLAFILLCLRGIARPDHPDRRIADLLWFPTGGGKTEAYLGLAAFVLFLRRLRGRGAGVTIFMRYTLRLLTIQQFARACLLICACEAIRQDRGDLGDESVSIGLWVGRGGTPNDRKDAATALGRLKKGAAPQKGNPQQLSACPWCGKTLDTTHYWMGDHPARLVVGCRNVDCRYARGLPVYLVDQDIYDYRPSLLIATSDKFASMPWQERCRQLFNLGVPDAPPELVIQDELHLISGPLGTLAGLYETAVDLLCEREGDRPKVIASTATIRRADRQTRALFDRSMVQFPPPALDARNSYFAVEASPDERGDRLYVGALAPAASHATLMIRTYARLLQSVADDARADDVKDPYFTLLGYFNSLRVLGGARMQVQDDVVDRINLLAKGGTARLLNAEIVEMTSRRESGEIPRYLSMMERGLPDAVDLVLATNMISVGVDVDRLGLMVVMGQPQSTSEYIQATSRIGRQHPGLVVTLLNSARSRDRSHYEGFRAYHAALYRQVESTSVTPFSSRARDRGLHAVLIAVARLSVSGMLANSAAGAAPHHVDELREVRDRIVARVVQTMPEQAERTREELDEVIEMWVARARQEPGLVYSDFRNPQNGLLVDAATSNEAFGNFGTLYSLRDVDVESELAVVR